MLWVVHLIFDIFLIVGFILALLYAVCAHKAVQHQNSQPLHPPRNPHARPNVRIVKTPTNPPA